ncbi:hypothetical protein HT585_24820 [Ensifer sp. HO-A22]|uniref:Uncharacterized protein n=1 Tax=Ensifer oleiphilus TaxID=2742698 RepID=A0A7Y6QAI4_9HYPH|nr:hypothetical protein [Ensifer oleiphilus]NVD42095.1 hypothetical protein [Ensifer oleiphilus]
MASVEDCDATGGRHTAHPKGRALLTRDCIDNPHMSSVGRIVAGLGAVWRFRRWIRGNSVAATNGKHGPVKTANKFLQAKYFQNILRLLLIIHANFAINR